MNWVPPVIFINGPPRSGKDTLADHIVRTNPGFKKVKFAQVLKERTHALYGHPDLPHDWFEETKDVPNAIFLGQTPRQAYINVSEKLMKPIHGKEVFGELLLAELVKQADGVKAFVVSDSGFADEAFPVIRWVGGSNCILVRIHAEKRGCTFANDSRSHIDLPIDTFNLDNNSGECSFMYEAKDKLGNILQSIVGGR